MASLSLIAAVFLTTVLLVKYFLLDPLVLSPLSRVPGPRLYALTKWRLAYEDWNARSTRTILQLHEKYGPVVRIGPNQVSFNSLTAVRTIYGPGSRFGRTDFYRMFDVYGRQNLFTFFSAAEHGQRKKLLSHAYSKSVVLRPHTASMIEEKTKQYLALIETEPDHVSDIFATLHYYSLDNITEFLYGSYGSTSALQGSAVHRELIGDILDPSRRRLSWFTVHFGALTKWAYSRSGVVEMIVRPLLPMQKPATYTGIRDFALKTYQNFGAAKDNSGKGCMTPEEPQELSILEHLWHRRQTRGQKPLDDLDIASECADHFLAGIDTTSDTLMFLIWSLSQPANSPVQEKLREEVLALSGESLNGSGIPTAEASDKCTYLNAVIKETLRLYAPLPSFEPRMSAADSIVDEYKVPAGTIVGVSPFALHRNPHVFEDPLTFNPDRWLGPEVAELNRWFWAFSSGGRMCIGIQSVFAMIPNGFQTLTKGNTLIPAQQLGHGRNDHARSSNIPEVQNQTWAWL
ncbi:hypothetical protein VTK73DRAFT_2091 [Phialemonium thermophilum]|uniref:Cytochrome P450 n=1 Tax=Phialemonium thermophilum TaxID=223376 RepID=A0ABR3X5Y5_9PEZI